uniref:CUE domain-containing protein n=1 Tax=Timema shepardi TaxID=629360 RepID=A0A7R9G0N9_TIMSH|nr:unnamed protein product [Timema shepardi]
MSEIERVVPAECVAATTIPGAEMNVTPVLLHQSIKEAVIVDLCVVLEEINPHTTSLKCLEYYNYSSESVIHALLESSLASSLADLDQSLPRIPLEAESKLDLLNSGERSNVFDNDEFDIMTRDYVDTTRIHRGKRVGKHKDLASMLNDKTHVTELGEKFKQLGLVDVYEDEYEDTYDHVDISVDEACEPERGNHKTEVYQPRGLAWQESSLSQSRLFDNWAKPKLICGSWFICVLFPSLLRGTFISCLLEGTKLSAGTAQDRNNEQDRSPQGYRTSSASGPGRWPGHTAGWRPLVVPQILRTRKHHVEDSDEYSEEEEEEKVEERTRDQFVENPESIRAKAEQRRQLKFQRGGGRGQVPHQAKDVVGNWNSRSNGLGGW